MADRLPPLAALRAFEAAARLNSFVRAAAELHVTPAAVSHQVKALEADLGVTLFRRLPRGLALTEAGRSMLPELTRGLDHFRSAVRSAAAGEVAGELRVTLIPSFAQLWLLPRLHRFLADYPDVDLRLVGTPELVDLRRSDVDLAIRYGTGRYPGLWSQLLFREESFPVCAPALLDGPPPLRRPADLARHRLLHDANLTARERWLAWPSWLDRLGVVRTERPRDAWVSDSVMLVEAATRGLGVAIGRTGLAADLLAAGRLVRPFPDAMPADYAYWAVCPEGAQTRPRLRAFIGWLLAESAAMAGALAS